MGCRSHCWLQPQFAPQVGVSSLDILRSDDASRSTRGIGCGHVGKHVLGGSTGLLAACSWWRHFGWDCLLWGLTPFQVFQFGANGLLSSPPGRRLEMQKTKPKKAHCFLSLLPNLHAVQPTCRPDPRPALSPAAGAPGHLRSELAMASVGEHRSLCEPVSPPACQAGDRVPWVLSGLINACNTPNMWC